MCGARPPLPGGPVSGVFCVILLGSDIVDLLDPDCTLDGLHPRFISRAFHPSEEELASTLVRTGDRRAFWLLWAAREAAYKAQTQAFPHLPFVWPSYEVRPTSAGRFQVTTPLGTLVGLEISGPETCLHVVVVASVEGEAAADPTPRASAVLSDALAGADERVVVFTAECEPSILGKDGRPTEGELIRHWALDRLRDHLRVKAAASILTDPQGAPYFTVQGIRRGTLSLSHHGRFLGAAYLDERWAR